MPPIKRFPAAEPPKPQIFGRTVIPAGYSSPDVIDLRNVQQDPRGERRDWDPDEDVDYYRKTHPSRIAAAFAKAPGGANYQY